VERPDNASTELSWTADGAEYELVRFAPLPETREEMVTFLHQLLNCDEGTAEVAYRLMFEDGPSFEESMMSDIARLQGTGEGEG